MSRSRRAGQPRGWAVYSPNVQGMALEPRLKSVLATQASTSGQPRTFFSPVPPKELLLEMPEEHHPASRAVWGRPLWGGPWRGVTEGQRVAPGEGWRTQCGRDTRQTRVAAGEQGEVARLAGHGASSVSLAPDSQRTRKQHGHRRGLEGEAGAPRNTSPLGKLTCMPKRSDCRNYKNT